jgi:hypothetical protein
MKLSKVVGIEEDPREFAGTADAPFDSFIGVEVELEGAKLSNHEFKYWEKKEDHSLRGNGAVELASKYPYKFNDLVVSLAELESSVDSTGGCSPSDNCSVHVHVDIRDLEDKQFLNMLVTYSIVEDMLFNYCGVRRRKSKFCVPWADARGQLDDAGKMFRSLSNKVTERNIPPIRKALGSFHKYSGLNLLAAAKYGSLEFRMHPPEYRAEPLFRWINILLKIKKFAMFVGVTPEELLARFSMAQPEQFAREVFAETADLLLYEGFETGMYEGVQVAQDIISGEATFCAQDTLLAEIAEVAGSVEESAAANYMKNNKLSGKLKDPKPRKISVAGILDVNLDELIAQVQANHQVMPHAEWPDEEEEMEDGPDQVEPDDFDPDDEDGDNA